jgi:hypothetical protein
MLKNFSFDWYRKAGRVNQPKTYIGIGTTNGGTSLEQRLIAIGREIKMATDWN